MTPMDSGLQSGTAELCFGAEPTIVAEPGQHYVIGTSEGDVIFGSPDVWRIRGKAGDDRICNPESLDDTSHLHGGQGSDRLRGGASLYGGPANDRLFAIGPNLVVLRGGEGRDRMQGHPKRDVFFSGEGGDTIVGTAGPCGIHTCDTVDFSPSKSRPVVADLRDGVIRNGPVETRIENIHYLVVYNGASVVLRGTAQLDVLINHADAPTRLVGRDGRDRLESANADDEVFGGPGKDRIRTFEGDDVLRGGDGNDSLQAGAGQDDRCVDRRGDNFFKSCEVIVS
jgi:Ca2+-binding RTX toxin-like protein